MQWLSVLAPLTFAVLSAGFFCKDQLSNRPLVRIAAGSLAVFGGLSALFTLGTGANKVFAHIQETQKQAQLHLEKAHKDEEAAINRELQAELVRLGCYAGKVDGIWGSQSSAALAEFLEARGKSSEYPDSVKVRDARRLFAEAPDSVCRRAWFEARADSLRQRYIDTNNRYAGECIVHFVAIPVEIPTSRCSSFKAERAKLALQLASLDLEVPK